MMSYVHFCVVDVVCPPIGYQTNSSKVPSLELFNVKSKAITVLRGSETLVINPSATQELRDGDIVHLVGGISTL